MKVKLTAYLVSNALYPSAWLERDFDLPFVPFIGLIIASDTPEAQDYDQPITEVVYHPATDSFDCYWTADMTSFHELEQTATELVCGGWSRCASRGK